MGKIETQPILWEISEIGLDFHHDPNLRQGASLYVTKCAAYWEVWGITLDVKR